MWRRAAVVAIGALALAGCGTSGAADAPSAVPVEAPAPSASASSVDQRLVPEAYDGRYRTAATVLESPDHGPQLCYSVATSLPPQCGGPDVVGWDWTAVPAETVRGTTWGDYELVGTFTDGAFTLTQPATARDPNADRGGGPPPEGDRFASPCPEPAGGWVPVEAIQAALPELPGWFGSGSDPFDGVVDLSVAHGTQEQQQALDEQFGAGAVRLSSQLEPID